jgi:hypothetical protein
MAEGGLLAEVVAKTSMVGVEGYSEVVLNAMDLAPTLGLTFGGDEKRLLNLFSNIEENRDYEEGVSVSNSKMEEGTQKFGMPH